jgi:4-hydroxybenzoate polyprenyltransferase
MDPIAFIAGIILSLALVFSIFYILSFDIIYWVTGSIAVILIWLNAWRVSRNRQVKL